MKSNRKPKPVVYNNKALAAEVARACEIPRDEARKIIQVILSYVVKQIRDKKHLSVRFFGRFKWYVRKRNHIRPGVFVPAAKASVTFVPSAVLMRILNNRPELGLEVYIDTLRKKIRRLLKQKNKNKKLIKAVRNKIKKRLETMPITAAYVERTGGIP